MLFSLYYMKAIIQSELLPLIITLRRAHIHICLWGTTRAYSKRILVTPVPQQLTSIIFWAYWNCISCPFALSGPSKYIESFFIVISDIAQILPFSTQERSCPPPLSPSHSKHQSHLPGEETLVCTWLTKLFTKAPRVLPVSFRDHTQWVQLHFCKTSHTSLLDVLGSQR